MSVLTSKVSAALDSRLADLKNGRGVPKSVLVREAIEAKIAEEAAAPRRRPANVIEALGDRGGSIASGTSYRSIFNPAGLKVRAMQSEMPKKYWKNLPEAPLIADLIAESSGRVEKMLRTEARPAKPAPKNAYLDSLREMNATEPPPPDA